jgi:hypothetical protein
MSKVEVKKKMALIREYQASINEKQQEIKTLNIKIGLRQTEIERMTGKPGQQQGGLTQPMGPPDLVLNQSQSSVMQELDADSPIHIEQGKVIPQGQ